MSKSVIVHGLKLLGRQHDLEPLFPHQPGSAPGILHGVTSYKVGKTRKVYKTIKWHL
jgi:hypothetical protein